MFNAVWNYIQAFSAGVIALGGAGTIFVGLYRWAKKPDQNRDDLIKEHSDKLDKDYESIQDLQGKQKKTEQDMQILMQSMLALMSHAIDGNHMEELKQTRDDLQKYLIRR
jgi:Tfp pilus assembly protein PilN